MMILPGTKPLRMHRGRSEILSTRSIIMLTLFSLFSCPLATSANAAPADEAAYTAGLQAVKAGDHRKAITLFSRAIELDPNNYRYYNDRGIAYKISGDTEKAIADYNKALEIKPDYPNALNNRGLLQIQQQQYDRAIADFSQALRDGGFEAKIHTNLGIALAGKGDHEAAVKEFQAAMSFRPMDSRSFLLMAQSLEQLGKKEQALKMYQVALGVVNDPSTEDSIEQRIAALEKTLTPVDPEPSQPIKVITTESAPAKEPPKQIARAEKPLRPKREILRAKSAAIPQPVQEKKPPAPEEPLPGTLEELNRHSRSRGLEKFAPNSAEIFRQGVQFVEQDDTKRALIRFEDALQLERRNKNALAVAWSMLETGRVYMKIGDKAKALASIEGAFRVFQRLHSKDEMILSLVEMAAVRKSAGQGDLASKLLSDAAREAGSVGNKEVATVLGDMAAGRPPTVKAQTSTAPVKAESRDDAPAARPSDTAIAQLDLVKRTEKTAGEVSKPKPAETVVTRPEPDKSKGRDQTQAHQTPPPPNTAKRGPMAWGRSVKAESDKSLEPQTPKPSVTDQKTQTQPAPTTRTEEKQVLRHPDASKLKPTSVETRVGGKPEPAKEHPSSTAPKPVVLPEKKQLEARARIEPALKTPAQRVEALPETILPHGGISDRRMTRQERSEGAQRRIAADLAELKRSKHKGDETSMIIVLERLARRYVLRRQYDKAMHGLTASLALREKLGLDESAAGLYDNRASIKQKLGDQPGALEDVTRALILAEAQSSTGQSAAALAERSRAIAKDLGLDPSIALEAFRSLWKARRAADGREETDALYKLGRLYDNAQRPSEALNYYERSSASVLVDKARVYEKMGKQKLAEQTYREAIEAFKKLDYSRYLTLLRSSGLDAIHPVRAHR